jgi:hypothetical protein
VRLGRKRGLGRLAIDIEGSKKSVLIAGDEGVALGEESLDETLAALAQRRGGPTGRLSVRGNWLCPSITANRSVLLDRVIAFSGFTASRGFNGPLPTRLVRFPLADPQETPYRRAHIWSR